MIRETIKNREGLNLVIQIEKNENSKALVFIMHGLGGFKEQPIFQEIAGILKEQQFTVVRFDATHSIGESEGNLEDATFASYYQDLEDVINYSKTQDWYEEPFFLIGHSLGGYCILRYTVNFPEKVIAVAPLSTAISGQFFLESPEIGLIADDWKKTGLRQWESKPKPGYIKKLKYRFVEESLNHNILLDADKIKCPVLLVVGEEDKTTPLNQQQILFDALKIDKEFHIIKRTGHTFEGENASKELGCIIKNWIIRMING
ncbi:MAG: alpha/beta fold hydrolase [Candidatus Paceibacterota bacterium]|jgi:pimeloyl-ACP methyl ester carboxylesterase